VRFGDTIPGTIYGEARIMRFAVLGYGKIAREVMIPSIQASGHEVVVIGSARGAAPEAFDGCVERDYFEVLRHDDVDAIYIALPNHLHHEMTVAALAHKKPVLCEKPIGLTAHQVKNLAESAQDNQTLLREAFMVAYHPQWHWLRSQIDGKEQINISVQFHYDNRDTLNIRNRQETGGGARLDIGCYALWAADWLGARTQKEAFGYQNELKGVDIQTCGTLWFDQGIQLHFDVSMRRARFQQVVVQTQDDCWVIPRPFNPSTDSVVWTMGSSGITDEERFIANQYERMIDAFCLDIESGAVTDLSRSLRIAQWSDEISEKFERRMMG
jgi:predicted dehydrogenase